MVSGWPRASPPCTLSSVQLIIPSISLCCRPDTTLTPTPLSFLRLERRPCLQRIIAALTTRKHRLPSHLHIRITGFQIKVTGTLEDWSVFSAPCSPPF